MNQTKIEFKKVRDFGALLNVTFDYIKSNFKTLFLSNLYISAPAILLAGVFMGMYQSSMFDFAAAENITRIGLPFIVGMFFTAIAYFIVIAVTYSHLMVYKESESRNFELDDVVKATKKNFSLILTTALGYVFLMATIGIITVGLGFFLMTLELYIFVLLFLFGMFFLMYLSIKWTFIFIVRLEEKLSFSDALRRSSNLIKDNWWFTFGLILVAGFIQGFMAFILYIPNYIAMFFVMFAGVDTASSGFGRMIYILSSIITSLSVLLYAINVIVITFHYFNLVERKEAPGLLQKVDEIQ